MNRDFPNWVDTAILIALLGGIWWSASALWQSLPDPWKSVDFDTWRAEAQAKAAATVEHMRAEKCQLRTIDLNRNSTFDCNGVIIWYNSDVTAAWLNGAEP